MSSMLAENCFIQKPVDTQELLRRLGIRLVYMSKTTTNIMLEDGDRGDEDNEKDRVVRALSAFALDIQCNNIF